MNCDIPCRQLLGPGDRPDVNRPSSTWSTQYDPGWISFFRCAREPLAHRPGTHRHDGILTRWSIDALFCHESISANVESARDFCGLYPALCLLRHDLYR